LVELHSEIQINPKNAQATMSARKERKDKMVDARKIIHEWWMTEGSRFESNKQGTRFCEVDDVLEEHTYRTKEYSNKAGFNNFTSWPVYTDYLKNGGNAVKLWLFLKMKCTCIIDPTVVACVNVAKQNTAFLFEALRQIVKAPGMRSRLQKCSCDKHEFLQIFNGEGGMLYEFLKMTLCSKVEVPELEINGEKFYMYDIDCSRSGKKCTVKKTQLNANATN
jgi:hypothetical protein